MSTRNIVKNIRSNSVGTNGKPKLPTPSQLDYGEIAVNYASGHETLSLKNDGNKIVSLSVNSVEDVKVNGSTVVSKSNKTAEITMKGDTIPVSGGQYSPMTYPKPFDGKAQQILATDMMDGALKTLETNISSLVTEVLDNEETSAAAIRKLAESAGTVDGSGNIGYQQAAGTTYISNAGSVHNATVILDSEINTLQETINNLQTAIDNLQGSIGQSSTVEWVNLGLSVMWAKCNVGAKKETDYGSYFMWGDIMNKTNSNCTWKTYKYCNGSDTTMTKYCTNIAYGQVDNKTTLEPEDDTATQIMGGNWRMPTSVEIQELIDNTTNEWITNYNGSGVNGKKFTSKINGNSIFIPASGYRSGSSFRDQGELGDVWSSSLYTTYPNYTYELFFNSSRTQASYNASRGDGLPVRGVCTLPL